MGKRVRRVWRDAMHAVEVETIEDATTDDFIAVMTEYAQSWPTSQKLLSHAKQWMRELVVAEGFPDPGTVVHCRGRFWCEVVEPQQGRVIGCTVSRAYAFIRTQTEPLSLCHHAAGIYLKALQVEWAIESGNVEDTFVRTFEFATDIQKLTERKRHLKNVDRGMKVAGGARNSAHLTNARHVPLREARFARMKALVPSLGVENAARQCEAENLGGWQAIRRQWDRHKQKTDT